MPTAEKPSKSAQPPASGTPHEPPGDAAARHGFTNAIVHAFLHSNLSLVLILLAGAIGFAALMVTPREEDPQIVVPLADVFVSFPGHSASQVEQLVTTPLEKLLYQIDGVEYVYSMSYEDRAIITVRFYVGEDRERSLVKLKKRIDENIDTVPTGVAGWVVKPVEIDDVPIVTLTLTSGTSDSFTLRRVGEEVAQRLAGVHDVSRAYVVGGEPRVVLVRIRPDRMRAYHVTPLDLQQAITGANVNAPAGEFKDADEVIRVETGGAFTSAAELADLVVGVFDGRPVFLKDVANVTDGPDEVGSYVRHGWGPARGFHMHAGAAGTLVGERHHDGSEDGRHSDRLEAGPQSHDRQDAGAAQGDRGQHRLETGATSEGTIDQPAVTSEGAIAETGATSEGAIEQPAVTSEGAIAETGATSEGAIAGTGATSEGAVGESRTAVTVAIAKKKGSNAVWVAQDVLAMAEKLKRDIIPDDMELVITRNSGLTANEKVNELIEALAVAILLVIAVLTIGLGWREALIVAVAVPVVFGLTLAVNLLFGFTINRVTLFALILSLGLLVDDPIVDVENIARHFHLRKRATRSIVQEAVAEIRPPLITATLAVIVSFLPMSFITGMMGPYMRPMALNVPVTMLMSMVVAFTITPWLAFHVLKRHYNKPSGRDENGGHDGGHGQKRDGDGAASKPGGPLESADSHRDDMEAVKQTLLYKLFYPLMAPLLHSRLVAWGFLAVMGVLTVAAMGLAATRHVPLKMLPFDNKNEILLVLDFDEGTTLERSDAVVREMEDYIRTVPEVTDYTSYVGLASPMDFNGLVRHYYLRQGDNVAEIRVDFVGKKNRQDKSHTIGLRIRDELTAIAERGGAQLSLVELPPGPPVIASVVAEVYGRPDHSYADLMAAARTVRARLEREPGVVDIDDTIEAAQTKLVFVTDKEKAALNGVTADDIAQTIQIGLGGRNVGIMRVEDERNPLAIQLRLPRYLRSSAHDLSELYVKGRGGQLVPLAELGRWEHATVDQTIYHKNLRPVVYVFAETAGRPPADVVVDVQADFADNVTAPPASRARFAGAGWVENVEPRPLTGRTFLDNGSDVAWSVPADFTVDWAGEGEWKITLDVFRDLGLAFGAAMVGIYILLVGQTASFIVPVIVMLAIPLTILGIMPGFWLLNVMAGGQVGPYADPIFFTATGMIGMIALAGIVTRDSIILVDFIHLSLRRGRSLFDAIMESRVVRLRPILLTTATAMFSAIPIAIDPIFSGLAWALIFGLLASTVFTLFVIPVAYWLIYANKPGHGLPVEEE